MALVKPSIAGELSGKIAGTVYARNRAGSYARSWAKPVNPNSPAQSDRRSSFGYTSSMWGMLTEAQRDEWNGYASLLTRLNRFGESYTPTGRQVYMEIGGNLMLIGNSPLMTPPGTTISPGLTIGSLDPTYTGTAPADTTIGTLVANVTNVNNTDPQLVVWATMPLPITITNFKKYLKVGGAVASADGSDPADIKLLVTGIAGTTLDHGKQIGIAIKAVDGSTGLATARVFIPLVHT